MPDHSHPDGRARRRTLAAMLAGAVVLGGLTAPADAGGRRRPPTLRHTGSFFVNANLAADDAPDTPTSAEIVDVSADGRTLLYTDGLAGRLGFVDVSTPSTPRPLGAVDLGGDPTSVAIHRGWALVAVSTGESFVEPGGELLVLDIESRAIVRRIALAGQPDSVAVSPRGRKYAAIVIENQRDEDENDGLLPQLPAGALQVLDLAGQPDRWSLRTVDLTGLAEVAPDDPEPEYVDINRHNRAVVSMQENNHLVVVDLPTGRVVDHFSAGSTDLDGIDTVEEELGPQGNGLIDLGGSLRDRRREPDTVAWIDHDTFATANEGDYTDADGVEGGSRGFTLFNVDGTVEYESGSAFEHEVVRAGHYPESRSENKGAEPEGLEVGRSRGRTLLFVAAERANVVGVYDVTRGAPEFVQLLPTGIGPEGLKVFGDGALAVTSEVDGADEGFAARPVITLFEPGDSAYPMLESADVDGLPIPWVAMSGLAGDPHDGNTMWAVSDSILAQAFLYRLDVSASPAVITERIAVGGVEADPSVGDFDLEGVAVRPEGGFWLGSEGRTNEGSARPNLLVRVADDGAVIDSVPLPEQVVAGATSSGIEGVAVTGTEAGGDEVVWAVVQREWADDPEGFVKVGRYEVVTGTWTFARYPLDAVESPAGGWVGLSEVTARPDGRLSIIERDNQLGTDARIKRIYEVDPATVAFATPGGDLPVLAKRLERDLLGRLDDASISVPDKLEGHGVTADGRTFVVTDNDGVDENYGETVFLELDGRK